MCRPTESTDGLSGGRVRTEDILSELGEEGGTGRRKEGVYIIDDSSVLRMGETVVRI